MITKYIGKSDTVKVPETIDSKPVASIGDEAFDGCKSLTAVIIQNCVTSIGYRVFRDCSSLKSVTIPYHGEKIHIHEEMYEDGTGGSSDKNFFEGCDSLENVTVVIPSSITVIDESAFERFVLLTNVIIQNGVTTVGEFAFSGCTSLMNVKIFA